MTALTPTDRADRTMSERELQGLVVELAALFGWLSVHWRAARTDHGWRVPVSGPLGKGWVDLVLVSPQRRRTIAVDSEW